MKRKKYSPPRDRLGIRSFVARTIALTPEKFFIGKAAFKFLVFSAPLSKVPIISWFYKKIILMSKSDYSQGYSIPLNIKITDSAQQVTLPIDLMKKAVKDAEYRAIMHRCICREAQGCQNYPLEIGCLFLGDAAKICVKNDIATQATAQQCYDHIDMASDTGLSGQALWVEVEKYLWGFENQNANKFMEFCFCCPCCCTGFKFADRADQASRNLFHRTSGWIARVDPNSCVQCKKCIEVCPRHAIELHGITVQINEACGGCGLCIPSCKKGAIELYQASEMKKDIKNYFEDIDFKI